MNRTLIGLLDRLNKLLAFLIVLACGLGGMAQGAILDPSGPNTPNVALGAIGGILIGCVAAAIICGLLAIFIEIERNLRELVAAQILNADDRTNRHI